MQTNPASTAVSASERAELESLFDSFFYLSVNRDVAEAGVEPLSHYLHYGALEGRDPSPRFDTSYYAQAHDLSSKENPLRHYARIGKAQGLNTRPGSRVEFEQHCLEVSHMCAQLAVAASAPFSHLFVLATLFKGGFERTACNFLRGLAEQIGIENILMLVTDESSKMCIDWLPEGTRLVTLGEIAPMLSVEDRAVVLLNLIETHRPRTVFIFNSSVMWSALAFYRPAYGELCSKFVGYLGGYEDYVLNNAHGFNDGLISRSVQFVDLFITDNNKLKESLHQRYDQLNGRSCRVATIQKPVPPHLLVALTANPQPASATETVKRILWAGRLEQQKRPDILAHIAKSMPDVQFDVFGWGNSPEYVIELNQLKNVNMQGQFADFSQIPLADKAALLFTSESDGLPNVLLEAAVSGLPIIAPAVGGIGEIINDTTGWLIPRFDDVTGYVQALQFVLENPRQAQERAARARDLVGTRHSWAQFCRQIQELNI